MVFTKKKRTVSNDKTLDTHYSPLNTNSASKTAKHVNNPRSFGLVLRQERRTEGAPTIYGGYSKQD